MFCDERMTQPYVTLQANGVESQHWQMNSKADVTMSVNAAKKRAGTRTHVTQVPQTNHEHTNP